MARHKDNKLAAHHAASGDPWTYPGPLSDKLIEVLAPPASGNRLKYDTTIKGFAARITAAGARSFVLGYRAASRALSVRLESRGIPIESRMGESPGIVPSDRFAFWGANAEAVFAGLA
jgi:hypothetical protein